ncbi:MAG: DUF4249 domain-containing protein [Saprospiraceae bacterium]
MKISRISSISYFVVLLLASVTLWVGCDPNSFQKDIEVDIPDHSPQLAVSSHLTQGAASVLVYVNSSLGVLSSENLEGLKDAMVTLEINGETRTLPYLYDPISSFAYPEGTYGITGLDAEELASGNYELKISAPGFDAISAQQTMSKAVKLTNAEYLANDSNEGEGLMTFEFTDPSGDENYYAFDAVFYTRTSDGATYNQKAIFDVDEETLEGEFTAIGPIVADQTFDGQSNRITFNTFGEYAGWGQDIEERYVLVILRSISEDKFRFFRSLERYENSVDNPFAEPVIIHDNINSGYGVFTTETRDTIKIILE